MISGDSRVLQSVRIGTGIFLWYGKSHLMMIGKMGGISFGDIFL
jgi:hypothetical protein